MIDYSAFFKAMVETPLNPWLDTLKGNIDRAYTDARHGKMLEWQSILEQLPDVQASAIELTTSSVTVGAPGDCTRQTQLQIESLLHQLHPWRKGPFNIHGVAIDTEWRSDWKWDRIKDHIQSLDGRVVLDVGCGSGYHCWRMAGAGAKLVIGIDPTMLYVIQHQAIQHFANDSRVHVLPFALEDLPKDLSAFDTVFSMGVLYHRRSPFDHLYDLRACLRSGGELVLETLVIDGGEGKVLVPEGRYAKMRNVWFLPSVETMMAWLKKAGFVDVSCVDVTQTTVEEQRSTDWMTFESLADFLDQENPNLTIEGYPAPRRALFVASSP